MTCRELAALLSEYLDGEVSEAIRTEIESHLADCEYCRAELNTLRTSVKMLRALSEVQIKRPEREDR